MNNRTDIKDVARQARVSISTVSRVLAGYPHVSPEKREQVLKVIKQLNYRPHQVARSLRRRRTNLIGLIVSTIENVFFTEVAQAAEQTAQQYDYNLIVCNTGESPEQEEAYLRILVQQMVAGIVLAPAPGKGDHLMNLIENELPLILINRRLDHLPCSSVTSNDREAAFECVSHLISEGRRRIAAITGLPGIYTTQERRAGYHMALEAAGLKLDPALEVTGYAHLEGGYRAALELMQRPDPPDALFVFNNFMTQGVVIALQDLGIGWPNQVDVAGFGVFKTARLYRPPLTLIDQPAYKIGERAVEMLIEKIESQTEREPEAVVMQNHLITRDTWLQQAAARPYGPAKQL